MAFQESSRSEGNLTGSNAVRPPESRSRERTISALRGGLKNSFLSMASIICLFTIDRKSTRLNSSHANISYAVFCLQKQNTMLNATAAYPAATEPWLHLGGRGAWAVVPRWTSMHPEHAFQRVLLSIM